MNNKKLKDGLGVGGKKHTLCNSTVASLSTVYLST